MKLRASSSWQPVTGTETRRASLAQSQRWRNRRELMVVVQRWRNLSHAFQIRLGLRFWFKMLNKTTLKSYCKCLEVSTWFQVDIQKCAILIHVISSGYSAMCSLNPRDIKRSVSQAWFKSTWYQVTVLKTVIRGILCAITVLLAADEQLRCRCMHGRPFYRMTYPF